VWGGGAGWGGGLVGFWFWGGGGGGGVGFGEGEGLGLGLGVGVLLLALAAPFLVRKIFVSIARTLAVGSAFWVGTSSHCCLQTCLEGWSGEPEESRSKQLIVTMLHNAMWSSLA
jgi:hypothetical protein